MSANKIQNRIIAVTGGVLIAVGAIMLAATTNIIKFDWAALWPLLLIIAGALFALAAFGIKPSLNRILIASPGIALFLLGGFFLAITSGPLEWDMMQTLWPIFPFVAGVIVAATSLLDKKQSQYSLVFGTTIAATSLALLLFMTIDSTGAAMAHAWPIIVVGAGAGLLVGAKVKQRR